jgi:hypothetical protein
MGDIISLGEYKKAKTIVEGLGDLIPAIDNCIELLLPFGKFKGASECLSVLKNHKTIMEIQYNNYKRILENGHVKKD